MTKKHFIALADAIKDHNRYDLAGQPFTPAQIETIAAFCRSQNYQFKRGVFLGYIAGECGPSGGKLR